MTTTLHVETFGQGSAPVVLLHSSGLSGRQWRRLVPELGKRGLRAVVPDLTGHGASAPWPEPEPFSFRRDVDEIVELLRAEAPAHVVAHSYGGLIGLHAAAKVPDAIRSLTLYDPVAFGVLAGPDDVDARTDLGSARLEWGPSRAEQDAWLCQFVDYWGAPGAWSALREEARAEFRRVGWIVREGVRSLMADTTRADAFAGLTVPTHLFRSDRSPLAARRAVERLGAAIPGATVTTIPGVGHMGPVANADIVNPFFLAAIPA